MNSRKTLKSVSVNDLEPTITFTPIIESYGEGYRIHHIKSWSIAHTGRDTFVPLRHISKQKQRIFELEEENEKLRKYVKLYITAIKENGCDLCPYEDDIDICDTETEPMCEGCILREEMCKLGIEVD